MSNTTHVTGYPSGPGFNASLLDGMSTALARNWWAVALRGVFAMLFGLVALFWPFTTILSLTVLFAVYMLADGAFAIVAGMRAAARHERWGVLVLEGIVDLLAGLGALLLPGLTVLVFVAVLGIWAVVSGVAMMAASFRLNAQHGRWLLGLSGLVSIVWGVVLYLSPVTGAVVLTWWLGGYAFVFGILLIVLAFRLRNRHRASQRRATT